MLLAYLFFVPLELQAELLDEHLLEHYMYYALVALQNPQPKIRVGGLSILVTVTASSDEHSRNVLSLLPSFEELVHDQWWEVQAQLLLLTAQLLTHLANSASDGGSADGSVEGPQDEEVVERLLFIVGRLFGELGTSKIVLQVGLCALVRNLRPYPTLLPAYVAVLLRQPVGFRARLLYGRTRADEGAAPPPRRLSYVLGTSSRVYDECCICDYWPSLDVARAIADQGEALQLDHFDPEHLQTLAACLPDQDSDLNDEWLAVFEKVKAYIFVALVDPALHGDATDVVKRFWLCHPQNTALKAMEASKKTLLQTLRISCLRYTDTRRSYVDEEELLDFLREMRDAGGAIAQMLQSVVDQFREAHNAEFQRSSLGILFE